MYKTQKAKEEKVRLLDCRGACSRDNQYSYKCMYIKMKLQNLIFGKLNLHSTLHIFIHVLKYIHIKFYAVSAWFMHVYCIIYSFYIYNFVTPSPPSPGPLGTCRKSSVNRLRGTVRSFGASWRNTRRYTLRSDGGVSAPSLRTTPSGSPSIRRRGKMSSRMSYLLWPRRRRWVWLVLEWEGPWSVGSGACL